MARIVGIDLPREKRVVIGLTYIYGTYLNRYVIRPRLRSYGESSTVTLSPGKILIKFILILQEKRES